MEWKEEVGGRDKRSFALKPHLHHRVARAPEQEPLKIRHIGVTTRAPSESLPRSRDFNKSLTLHVNIYIISSCSLSIR